MAHKDEMKAKIIISIAAGFLLGFLAHSFLPHPSDTTRHWRAVERFDNYVRDPSNYKLETVESTADKTPRTFWAATPPYDPEPDLASLVQAGELRHLDIVLPSVPHSKTATRHWMEFCERHRDVIVYATGNPRPVAFKPKGTQPEHLNLWYKPSGEVVIQQLITELENLEPEKAPPSGRTVPPEAAGPGGQ